MYLRFLGRSLYLTREPADFRPTAWFHHVYQLGEHLLWLGRLHVIYTPRNWQERRQREAPMIAAD